MIMAHDDYLQGHAALFTASTGEELLSACAKTVENYLENRRIWDELNHYKTTGVLLGQHPLFARRQKETQLQAMRTGELIALRTRHANNLIRGRKALRVSPHDRLSLRRRERTARLEQEISMIDSILATR